MLVPMEGAMKCKMLQAAARSPLNQEWQSGECGPETE